MLTHCECQLTTRFPFFFLRFVELFDGGAPEFFGLDGENRYRLCKRIEWRLTFTRNLVLLHSRRDVGEASRDAASIVGNGNRAIALLVAFEELSEVESD